MIGNERAAMRKSTNSDSNRLEVTIDKVLCLCNGLMNGFMDRFMVAVSRPGRRDRKEQGRGSHSLQAERKNDKGRDRQVDRIRCYERITSNERSGLIEPERLLVPHPQTLVSWISPHHRTMR